MTQYRFTICMICALANYSVGAAEATRQQATAATPPVTGFAQAQPATTSFAALDIESSLVVRDAKQPEVCEPAIVDNKVKLEPTCINRIVNLGVRKGRYRAATRNKRELRSLCENQFLPRCRHKY